MELGYTRDKKNGFLLILIVLLLLVKKIIILRFYILKRKTEVMASIRTLKKDIDMLMSMVLNDCFYIVEYNPKVDTAAVMKIAGSIIEKHREYRLRINHPDGKDDPKLVKKYYSDLSAEVLETADEAFNALSEEVKKAGSTKT
jgi:hypothetical protein